MAWNARWAGLILGVATVAGAKPAGRLWREAPSLAVQSERSVLHRVAQRALPAVVSITTVDLPKEPVTENDETEPQVGVGAGFFIHPDGYLLTSAHVVSEAAEVQVTLPTVDGARREEYPARVLGKDEETDLALLKVDAPRKFPTLELGSSRHVGVADWVVVIGSPFGLSHSVSVGVVSSTARPDVTPGGRMAPFDYLQTDAAINPGNSGGPVLDLGGHVVAIANSVNVSGQGIGFAVPVDFAKRVIPELRRYGHARRGWMGVAVEDAPSVRGARVSSLADGSPAQLAGLRVGDVIVQWGRTPLERAMDLRRAAVQAAIGNRVSLHIERGETRFRVSLLLAAPPEPPRLQVVARRSALGVQVAEVDTRAGERTGLARPFGALIESVQPQSLLARAGLEAGDVVLKVNRTEVFNQDQFLQLLGELPTAEPVRLFLRRGQRTLALSFEP